MKLYNVEVVETLSRVVEQQANSYDEAEDIVYDKYRNGDIVLEPGEAQSKRAAVIIPGEDTRWEEF